MITLAFWATALSTAFWATPRFQTPEPFEWVGELAAGVFAMLLAYALAMALGVVLPEPTPWPSASFQANFAPPYTGDLA